MTFEQFIIKWHGLPVDYDGHWGNQCVDLYRMYVDNVLGYPQSPGVIGAADIWTTYLPAFYERIPNTPTGVPLAGDIVIWSRAYGPFGHVAIFHIGNVTKFISLDQNQPLGTVTHLQHHNYKSVLGWLHPKGLG